jgi:hypothetical protein
MPEPQLLRVATIVSALAFGTVWGLPGGIAGALAKHLNIEEKRVRTLATLFTLALAPLLVVAGLSIDLWRVQEILIIGSVLAALGMVALAVSRTFPQGAASFSLLGMGGACLLTGSCVLMPRAFFPNSPSASANIGFLFVLPGVFLAGNLSTALLRNWSPNPLAVRRCLLVFALLQLIPGLVVAFASWGDNPVAQGDAGQVFNSLLLWLAALVAFAYAPIEATLADWSGGYLTESGHHPNMAETLTVGFWLSFLAGRLAFGLLLGWEVFLPNAESWIIVAMAVVAAVVLGNMIQAVSPRSAWFGLVIVGAALGAIFPTILGVGYQLTQAARGTACGIVCAAAALGRVSLAPLLGLQARRSGAGSAMRTAMILALIVAGAALILAVLLAE